ncbi:proteasome complex subunit Rpn13 ubiquitin receptor-domain-containing protein [Scleroderma yunnanense]
MSVLTDSQTLLAFKAGRSFRRANTNFVDAQPTKGALILSTSSDEGLLRLLWKERPSGDVHEDLILFPGDAKLEKVSQDRGGRTYVLKFESSDHKHFFWMQDASSARDDELVASLNRLLADGADIPAAAPEPSTTSTSHATTGASSSSTARAANAAAPPAGTATTEQLARLRALITSIGANTGAPRTSDPAPAPAAAPATELDDELALSDILTPDNLIPLFTTHPTLLPALFPHLPPDLLPSSASTSTPTPQQTAQLTEALQRTIHSPPFRAAVAQLDRALQTGELGEFVRGLGLPPSAGTGVGAFLRAIAEQARREGGDQGTSGGDMMDED